RPPLEQLQLHLTKEAGVTVIPRMTLPVIGRSGNGPLSIELRSVEGGAYVVDIPYNVKLGEIVPEIKDQLARSRSLVSQAVVA
ncbi:MAG: hypothetical protein AAB802_00815, partial [Patescibacteria group bacterium]